MKRASELRYHEAYMDNDWDGDFYIVQAQHPKGSVVRWIERKTEDRSWGKVRDDVARRVGVEHPLFSYSDDIESALIGKGYTGILFGYEKLEGEKDQSGPRGALKMNTSLEDD